MGRTSDAETQKALKAIRYELKKIFGEHKVKELMGIIKLNIK